MMAEALLRAPDAIEPRTGWRVWNVVEAEGTLRLGSLVYHTVWEPGVEITARCRRPLAQLPWSRMPLHSPPYADCRCGIYGVATPELALPYLTSPLEHGARAVHRVIGRVRLWGRVVEGAWGWRAAFAYPELLVVPQRRRLRSLTPFRTSGARIAAALDIYGIPVEVIDEAQLPDLRWP